MSTATTSAPIDFTKTPEQLAKESTASTEVIVSVNTLLLERVIAYKLRDVLPFVPASKRESTKQSKINEMVNKMFESTLKSMESAASVKIARATHPELFKK